MNAKSFSMNVGDLRGVLNPAKAYHLDLIALRRNLGFIPEFLAKPVFTGDSLKTRLETNYPFFSGWTDFEGTMSDDFVATFDHGEVFQPFAWFQKTNGQTMKIAVYPYGLVFCCYNGKWVYTRAD